MPQGRTVINAVDASGEPVDPITVQGPYKTAIGNIVRDNVPIKYQSWNGKEDPNLTVPDQIKELCWEKLLESFIFPSDSAREIAKKKVLKTMGERFKQFRCILYKHVKAGTEPDWDQYPSQRAYWADFLAYKSSTKAKEMSQRNTENALSNPLPHNLGTRGIVRKLPQWDAEFQEMEKNGVVPETVGWEMRSLIFALSHGSSHGPDGKLVSKDERAKHLVKRIQEVREEVSSGAFVPDRENDVLSRALGTKEHPGRVRGMGLVPWELGFAEYSDSYRSRSRSKAQREAVVDDLMQKVRDEMDASRSKVA